MQHRKTIGCLTLYRLEKIQQCKCLKFKMATNEFIDANFLQGFIRVNENCRFIVKSSGAKYFSILYVILFL